jgi:hypothetical protein
MVEAIEAEHDVRSDVGSSSPGTVEAVEAEHVGSWAPDVPEPIFLVPALHTPGLPSSSDQAADWPGFSIEEGPIDSGATAHDRLLHCLPPDPETRPEPPMRTPYPAAPPLFARISLVVGMAAMGNLCSHHRADLSVGRSFAQKRQQQSCRRTGGWGPERWYRRCRPRAATGQDELNHSNWFNRAEYRTAERRAGRAFAPARPGLVEGRRCH